jgi:hypothetical protein
MQAKTKTAVKPAMAKTAAKAAKSAPQAAQKAAPMKPYAALLKAALSGAYGPLVTMFYARAIQYHTKHATVFPRQRNADEPLLSVDDAIAFIRKHEKTSIPAGSKAAQRLFDAMMVESRAK